MRRASTRKIIVGGVSLGLCLALGGCSGSTAVSDADRRAVVVLSRHVRHQAALATQTAARASDASGRAIAQSVASRTSAAADQLDAVLSLWHVSAADADRIFAAATSDIPDVKGTPMFACSLRGPIDDVGQLDAATPAAVSARWAQLTMTSALEGLRLAAGTHAASIDTVQRALLGEIVPLLPVTDQALARSQSSS